MMESQNHPKNMTDFFSSVHNTGAIRVNLTSTALGNTTLNHSLSRKLLPDKGLAVPGEPCARSW